MFNITEVPGGEKKKLKAPSGQPIALVSATNSTQIGEIEIKPRPFLMPKPSPELLEKYHNFSVRENDVWITTYPKCGTTWMQEMCWLILNNYDYETAKQTELEMRSPYFEYNTIIPAHMLDTLDLLEKAITPRVIKTHVSIGLLPKEMWEKNPKIIHITRDPRDAAISAYHMMTGQGTFDGTLEEFLQMFLHPFIPTFWEHTLEFWKLRHKSNYLFLTYEDMKKDLPSVIQKVCTFLGTTITADQLEKMSQHLSFESMRNNPSINHNIEMNNVALLLNNPKPEDFKFIRKGQIGSYKTEFPPGYHKIYNEWIRDKTMGSDFNLYLED